LTVSPATASGAARRARLAKKVALVTGGAHGLGAAICRAFAVEGARVVVTDVDEVGAAGVARAAGPLALSMRLDVREELAWVSVLARVLDLHGRLDVLVNHAALSGLEHKAVAHDPEHASLEHWHAVHRTNLDGVFLGCKHAIRVMRRAGRAAGGSIINIASHHGATSPPGTAAYASSQAAVHRHTQSVARYCAAQGLPIRCHAIPLAAEPPARHPGAIDEAVALAVLLAGAPPLGQTRLAAASGAPTMNATPPQRRRAP
jgi:NAD(P)-dependent dehydrogenase (short-subunit alcohol dehydrogenase family)